MKVLGIDPGTLNLGWGYIETDKNNNIVHIDHHCLSVSAKIPFLNRLHQLDSALDAVVKKYQPEVTVVEKIFLGKNVDSAFKLGHIRGVCVVKCQLQGSSIAEYTPKTVKKQITGYGNADKAQVKNLLYRQLGLADDDKTWDASDALALAFCHVLQSGMDRFREVGFR